jgi:hypothetical protein
MATPNGLNPVFDSINAKKPIISQTNDLSSAARTMHPSESGSLFLFDADSTATITLPTPEPGIFYDFLVPVTSTSTRKITTGSGVYLLGGVINIDTDTTNTVAFYQADGGTHRVLTLDGTTKGGIKGTQLRFTGISTTVWQVNGVVQASGTVATPFSAS